MLKIIVNEKKTFVKKIKEILQNIKDWFNSYLDKVSSKSPEAKIIREATDRIDGQIELWDAMLKSSIETNQALQNEGITGEELAKPTNKDVKHSHRDVEKGKKGIIMNLILLLCSGLIVHRQMLETLKFLMTKVEVLHYLRQPRMVTLRLQEVVMRR